MKNVLLIKSPFQGMSESIGNVTLEYKEIVNFYILSYESEINQVGKGYNYLSPPYNPEDILIVRNQEEINKNEVVIKRFSDIIRRLHNTNYRFIPLENRLILSADDNFSSSETCLQHQPAIEKVASVIYRNIDAIFPIWIKNIERVKYKIEIRDMYTFFRAISDRKQNLFINKHPCEDKNLNDMMREYLTR